MYVDDPFGNRIELLEPTTTVSFRPLTVDDLELLVEWFADPVVAAWWNQPAEIESVRSKYLPRIEGTGDPTLMWIAEIDGEPAGLFQSYLHADYSEHDVAVGLFDAVGIDYSSVRPPRARTRRSQRCVHSPNSCSTSTRKPSLRCHPGCGQRSVLRCARTRRIRAQPRLPAPRRTTGDRVHRPANATAT